MVTPVNNIPYDDIHHDGYSVRLGELDFLLELEGTLSEGLVLSLDRDHTDAIDRISRVLRGKNPVRDGKVHLVGNCLDIHDENGELVKPGYGMQFRVVVEVESDEEKVELGLVDAIIFKPCKV